MGRNIVLVGFMGTGKTQVAQQLAKALGMEFVEMDSIIEEHEGMSINEIFATKGEPYFRKIESEVVKELAGRNGVVISTGGGVVLNKDNIDALQRNSTLICLDATPEEILARIGKEKHRPLLNVEDPLKRIKELLESRSPYYARISTHVNTVGKSIEDVVEEIKRLI